MQKHLLKRKNMRRTACIIILVFFVVAVLRGSVIYISNSSDSLLSRHHLETTSSFSTNTNSLEMALCEKPVAGNGLFSRRSIQGSFFFNRTFLSIDFISPLSDFASRIFATSASSKESHNIKTVLYCLKTVMLKN